MEAKTIERKAIERLDHVIIRFAGDSGDGMQLTGTQFTNTAAIIGNDLCTFPDYPAEIRAPAGTLPGVSGFQVNISSRDIHTPGDQPDVLVAMNPAALKVNIADLKPNGALIVNTDAFEPRELQKAGYTKSPLEDHSLDGFRVFKVPLTNLTRKSLEGSKLNVKQQDRCKNFFALGMMYWLYNRPLENTIQYVRDKFSSKPELVEANILALKGGYTYCEATEVFQTTYEVAPARLAPGKYRNISGNSALAIGLVAAAEKAGIPLFLGSYPITPASDVLHELSGYKNFGIVTFQAEDEIAAITATIGASYAGNLGVTTTSGPGMALKTEAIGLAVATELPLVIVNIQRGGPSTGLPTKTEQADLFQALFGRNGETPVPVLAAATPGDCFWMAYEACRIAIKYMTPVILLSDGYLANGAEPWRLPKAADLPPIPVRFRTDPNGFLPYDRDEVTFARPWAVPGTPGLEHRIGGLERQNRTGNVNYEPFNHAYMICTRASKVASIVQDVPDVVVEGKASGKVLVIGWGSTHGSIAGAMEEMWADNLPVSWVHLRHLNPLPRNLGDVLRRFERVVVPEMNLGQLAFYLRGKYLVDVTNLPKVEGKPYKVSEIVGRVKEILGGLR
jgi:2-oxoglutarate ferredoxin oxidoreductase subunit alpha